MFGVAYPAVPSLVSMTSCFFWRSRQRCPEGRNWSVNNDEQGFLDLLRVLLYFFVVELLLLSFRVIFSLSWEDKCVIMLR